MTQMLQRMQYHIPDSDPLTNWGSYISLYPMLPRVLAATSEDDASRAQVLRVASTLEVAEAFELPEQVVDGLLADTETRGELGGPRTLWARILEDRQVRRVEIPVSMLVQPLEHAPTHGLPGNAEQRSDQRRAGRPARDGKAA